MDKLSLLKKITNLDVVQKMSVTELAMLLTCGYDSCKDCPMGTLNVCANTDGCKQWLESEVDCEQS